MHHLLYEVLGRLREHSPMRLTPICTTFDPGWDKIQDRRGDGQHRRGGLPPGTRCRPDPNRFTLISHGTVDERYGLETPRSTRSRCSATRSRSWC